MNKLKVIIEARKVEIWKFLKDIRTLLKIVICVLFWMATFISAIFYWGMVNNANKMIDFLSGKPLYFEVMGNMVLIPLKFCLVLWIFDTFIGFYMRFVASKMNERELKEAGIISFFKSGRKAISKGVAQPPRTTNVNKVNKFGENDGDH